MIEEFDHVIDRLRAAFGDGPPTTALVAAPHDPAAWDAAALAVRRFLETNGDPRLDGGVLESLLVVGKLDALGLDHRRVRARSVAELSALGLPTPPEHLPTILETSIGHRRGVQEIVDRCRALLGVLFVAHGAWTGNAMRAFEPRGLLPFLSEREREMIDATIADGGGDGPSAQLRAEMTWRVEALLALGWALGIVDELPLTGMTEIQGDAFDALDPDAAAGVPAGVVLRPEPDLIARDDALYCAHWVARDAALRGAGRPQPDGLNLGAVHERRQAIEWILGDVPWDDMAMST